MRFKINIKATNLELTPSLRSYIKEKIGGLEKLISRVGKDFDSSSKSKPALEGWVEIEKTTHHHYKGDVFRAECQIKLPGRSVRAESLKDDLLAAITELKDKLQRELKQYKKKQIIRTRKSFRKLKEMTKISSPASPKKK